MGVRSSRQRRCTRALWLPVYMNSASSTETDTATKFRAVKVKNVTQHPQQRGVGRSIHGGGLSVNDKGSGHSLVLRGL